MLNEELNSLPSNPGGSNGVEAFLESWGREILRTGMTPLDGNPLDIDLLLRSLPGSPSPMCRHHTSALVDNGDLILVVVEQRAGEMNQHGRVAMVAAGQAALSSNGAPVTFSGLTPTHVVNFRLSRNLLKPQVADLDGLVARPIPNDDRILQLLRSTTNGIYGPVATCMHDLAVLLLGNRGSGPRGSGLRAARLRAIKDDILDRIGQHTLSMGDMVKSQQISESYIRQLMAEDGTTFTDFVLDERLQRAHRMLTDPASETILISAIAYEAGFGDLSYFNRTFRRRYGTTPSAVRNVARLGRLQLKR